MKQFSGLYPQYSMSKLPIANVNLSQSSINKSSSIRNIVKISNPPKRKQAKPLNSGNLKESHSKANNKIKQIGTRQRLSKSIQEIPQLESDEQIGSLFGSRKMLAKNGLHKNGREILIQNCEDSDQMNEKDQQFFSEPYKKLNKVYNNFEIYKSRSGIQEQLSQILQLIKQQRTLIRNKLSQIQSKKSKKQCVTVQSGQNTEQIIFTNSQTETKQIETQTEQISQKLQAPSKQRQKVESNQTYLKLIKILEDMKINSKLILPQEIDVEEIKSQEDKKYQELKDSQIITVQKFVIKKLVQKITSMEAEGHPA